MKKELIMATYTNEYVEGEGYSSMKAEEVFI